MKPVEKGRKAFYQGQPRGLNLVNPYPEGTNRHREWQFGFNQAYFENLERVKLKEAHN